MRVAFRERSPTNDGFQSNWLHFLTVSLGVTLDTRGS